VAVAAVLVALYGTGVAFAVFWPTPIDRDIKGSISRLLDLLHGYGVPDWLGYVVLEFSANIAMFIPLGFLIFFVLPRSRWWLALLICPALSITIEVVQGVALSQRFATVSDVIANTLGGIIGVLLALGLRRLVNARDRRLLARNGVLVARD